MKTAALLIGFGGPQGLEEVRPFLQSVLEGVPVPPARVAEVAHHYEIFNGRSPYNEVSFRQKQALERWFASQKIAMPVEVGFRHSSPSFRDAFETFKKQGVTKVIGFILASFRSYSSFEKYQLKIAEAQKAAAAEDIRIEYTESFAADPLYFEAQAEQVRAVRADRDGTCVLFCAHSIPVPMSDKSGYASQFEHAAASIASLLGIEHWRTAYQSRSGNPRDPWLEPDVKEVIAGLDRNRFGSALLVPVGFLCDNVEVLYDLDVEAKQACEAAGLRYLRASTVTDHPKFIEAMGLRILEKA